VQSQNCQNIVQLDEMYTESQIYTKKRVFFVDVMYLESSCKIIKDWGALFFYLRNYYFNQIRPNMKKWEKQINKKTYHFEQHYNVEFKKWHPVEDNCPFVPNTCTPNPFRLFWF
jgi:hypothetical protein